MADFDISTLPRKQASLLNPYIDNDSFSTTLNNVCLGLSVIQDIDPENEGVRESTSYGIFAHCQALISALTWESMQPARKNVLDIPGADRVIQSRDDLSFTSRDEKEIINNWDVPHDSNQKWEEGLLIGQKYFDEVRQLAAVDEREAFHAIEFAFNSGGWRSGGWGIESGFSRALAKAAIIGMRALQNGEIAFDEHAHTN